jgi:ADP-ribose pyrophosphatase
MALEAWKTLSSKLIYQNPWMRLREDIAELPDGKRTIYGVVEVNPAVGVLPFVDDEHVALVRQFRYVFGENQRWEMPTGGVKPGEKLEDAAQRELMEEVGYRAAELQPINTFYSSKSIMHEVAHLYIARGLSELKAPADDTEDLEVGIFPFRQVVEMVERAEIRDAMTMVAVLLAARRI